MFFFHEIKMSKKLRNYNIIYDFSPNKTCKSNDDTIEWRGTYDM